MTDPATVTARALANIGHFVVLMLENRSFDHLLGSLKAENPAIDGALDREYSNLADPAVPTSPRVPTGAASSYAMAFDPGHEFEDVDIQLYGRAVSAERVPAQRSEPAPMSGFVYSAEQAAHTPARAAAVMQGFPAERLPVLSALAREFAVFNYWHSSLPGPTWPNRFFAHAATSGGLSDSPRDLDILAGYRFPGGTIYRQLEHAGRRWRIYHDGLPQSAGIDGLRAEFLDPLTEKFRDMAHFEADLDSTLPEYLFIEPNYDAGRQYVHGNSMHPLNDVRRGERLIKRVYEALRASRHWPKTLLIVTFDEHGGFFDHVPPPAAVPPGGDQRYQNPANHFDFDRLGVRVPAVVASAYTERNTVIGRSPAECFDHTSILATVERRFGLRALSERDAAAQSRTLEVALNRDSPRSAPEEAPLTLPAPVADGLVSRLLGLFHGAPAAAAAPMSRTQRVQLTLAHACNLEMLDPRAGSDAHARYLAIRGQGDAAAYIQEVEQRVRDRRRP